MEYDDRGMENYGFTITELTRAEAKVVGKGTLPAPVTLTSADMQASNLAALEKFEGMRVKADSLTVTQATGGRAPDERNKYQATSDGVFFAVVTGTPRPFREPGVEVFIWQGLNMPKTVPWFDTNPEMIRVDTDALNGAKAHRSSPRVRPLRISSAFSITAIGDTRSSSMRQLDADGRGKQDLYRCFAGRRA